MNFRKINCDYANGRFGEPSLGLGSRRKMWTATTAVAVALSCPAPAAAQLIDDIVVTAQKREQDAQDVPVSISAFSGEAMERLGFQVPQSVAQQVPNVLFGEDGGLPQFNIRGVQLYDFGSGNEPPVGVYVDEIYMGTLGGHISELLDVERVEVLKGPQGTLFGRNTTGGLVHLISRKPTNDFSANVSLQYGAYNQAIAEGAVSGPLSESVRARIALKYNRDDGWQKNVYNGQRFASKKAFAGRAQLEVDFSPDVTGLFNFHASTLGGEAKNLGLLGRLNPADMTQECSLADIQRRLCLSGAGSPSTSPKRTATEISHLAQDVDAYGGFAKFDWRINGDITLTSITGYENTDRFYSQDPDASISPLAPENLLPVNLYNSQAVKAKQFTQELRMAGANWVVGAFYFNDKKRDLDFDLVALGDGNRARLDTESWAIFGQIDQSISENVYVTAGSRYTWEKKNLQITDISNPAFFDTQGFNTGALTWRLGLNWEAGRDTLVFANVSKGFKSGAFQTSFVDFVGQAAPSKAETLISYEAGVKSDLFNGDLKVSASTFYYDYNDLQMLTVSNVGNQLLQILDNIGDAQTFGAEADFTWRAAEGLEGRLGVGYIDTKLDSPFPQFDGRETARAPKLTLNGLVRYTAPWDIFGGILSLQGSFTYMGDHFLTPQNQPYLKQKAYALLGSRVRWQEKRDRYFVEAFVENITDKEYAVGAFDLSAPFHFSGMFWGTPRLWGIKIGANFY